MKYNICSIQSYKYVYTFPYMNRSNHPDISTHMFLCNYYILPNNYSDNPHEPLLQHLRLKEYSLK